MVEAGDNRKRDGFTLIELLAVMVIMAIMMSMSVIMFQNIAVGAGMRASLLNVMSSLNQARQIAITYRVNTVFVYSNTESKSELRVGCYCISTNGTVIGETNRLDVGIVFAQPSAGRLEFTMDGSCKGFDNVVETNIMIMERDKGANALSNMLTIYPFTGLVKVKY